MVSDHASSRIAVSLARSSASRLPQRLVSGKRGKRVENPDAGVVRASEPCVAVIAVPVTRRSLSRASHEQLVLTEEAGELRRSQSIEVLAHNLHDLDDVLSHELDDERRYEAVTRGKQVPKRGFSDAAVVVPRLDAGKNPPLSVAERIGAREVRFPIVHPVGDLEPFTSNRQIADVVRCRPVNRIRKALQNDIHVSAKRYRERVP